MRKFASILLCCTLIAGCGISNWRMAELRGRAVLGQSILDEIRAVRRACALAATSPLRTRNRDEIAASCGYASWSSVLRLLKGD